MGMRTSGDGKTTSVHWLKDKGILVHVSGEQGPEVLIRFEGWGKLAQQWFVCAPYELIKNIDKLRDMNLRIQETLRKYTCAIDLERR